MRAPSGSTLKALFFDAFASRPRPMSAEMLEPAVDQGGDQLRDLLAGRTATELSRDELRSGVAGNLWMLAPAAFRHFLPAFMHASLESCESLGAFTSELVGALNEPARADIVQAIDRLAQIRSGLGWSAGMVELVRRQQLEWFDSGTATATFRARFDGLGAVEGAAILTFLLALREAHGGDFAFGELETAIDRHWRRYRAW